MTKLSDTQAIILSAAGQREDRNVLPLPGSLRGGGASKVVGALLRGALAGALNKKLGLTVTSEKIDRRGRVYTICD